MSDEESEDGESADQPAKPHAGDAEPEPEPSGAPSPPAAPPVDPAVAADEESPAQVAKTFMILMALAGILCLLPRQYISAGVSFIASLVAGIIHFRRRRRSGTQ